MLEWGGENLEQSMRVWMCGGEIFVVRDSFVGHIFDRPPKPNPEVNLNLLFIAIGHVVAIQYFEYELFLSNDVQNFQFIPLLRNYNSWCCKGRASFYFFYDD